MSDARKSLETRKGDLLAAIRVLEQDHLDGTVDEKAYLAARQRYESEAADIAERLDVLGGDMVGAIPPRRAIPRWVFAAAVAGLLFALALFLISALHSRNIRVVTVASPAPARVPPSLLAQIDSGERSVRAHPRSVDAQIQLGNAFLNAGQTRKADGSYRAAMRLDATRPEAPTLHAMVLGTNGQTSRALDALKSVERDHPAYARAWLLDGLLAAKEPRGSGRAIAAWKRFLLLEPGSTLAPNVRRWIADVTKKKR